MANRSKFQIIGGDPALDFVNTEVIEAGERQDLLQCDRDLLEWAHAAKLLSVPTRTLRLTRRHELHAQVRPLRAALRHLFEAAVDGRRPLGMDLERVNELLLLPTSGAPLHFHHGRFEMNAEELPVDACRVLKEVAISASRLLTSSALERVRRCSNDRCILYFIDRSRGVGRRWCSMSVCGNRSKVAAHQRRSR